MQRLKIDIGQVATPIPPRVKTRQQEPDKFCLWCHKLLTDLHTSKNTGGERNFCQYSKCTREMCLYINDVNTIHKNIFIDNKYDNIEQWLELGLIITNELKKSRVIGRRIICITNRQTKEVETMNITIPDHLFTHICPDTVCCPEVIKN